MAKRVRNKRFEPAKRIEPIKAEVKNTDGAIRWKKLGGGSLRLGNHIIKPGQIFTARKDTIPEKFLNSLQALDPIPESEMDKNEPVSSNYTLKERGNNWYDVVNADGKPLNEKALRKDQADELLKSL